MYNLLIVDDEPIIVDGLLQLFSELEMELNVYSAYSATEALECALRVKMDIIISDMRMPEKNGLKLIEELRLLWPACRIIFLSGYDNFDYVYDAVKHNIDSYVLKTEDDQVLIDAVQKSITNIEESRSIQAQLEANKRQIKEVEPLIKREYLKSLLHGAPMKERLQSFSFGMNSLKIDLDRQWLMIAGQLEFNKGSNYEELFMLDEMMRKEIHPTLLVESCLYSRQFAIWFIQPVKDNGVFVDNTDIKWNTIKEYSKRFLESVQASFLLKTNTQVNFVIGKDPVNTLHVHEAFQQLSDMCKFISSFSKGMMILDQSKTNPFYHPETKVPVHSWKKELVALEGAISEGKEQKAVTILDELFDRMFNKEYSNLEITDFLFSISQLLLDFLQSKDVFDDVAKQQGEDFQKIMKHIPVLFDSKKSITSVIKGICQFKAKWREDGNRNIILIINEYIRTHLTGDLSLTAIADLVHFNPSYLSRYYKEETGRNLSDVIDELRVDKAIELLTQTDIPINEVGKKIGFNSPSYFTLFFRKHVHQSPQRYRENRRM